MSDERCVIVGAGPAGLAAAWALRRRRLDSLVVEQGRSVATVWRGRHDHLRLNTWRALSHQPGRRIPRRTGVFPSRDDYIAYLERYAAGMRIEFNTHVERVDRRRDGWQITTSMGERTCEHLVVATGPDREPIRPVWDGQASFTGRVIHAGEFRNRADVAGRDVLVVGPGNSGVDLLNHLITSDVNRLWLSARNGMTILPGQVLGVPLHPIAVSARYLPTKAQDTIARVLQRAFFGDLARYGYPRATVGPFTRVVADGVTAAVDAGFVKALKAGRVIMKPGVERFEHDAVVFTDGTRERPDVVITATGYRPGLESLVGHLVSLDHIGMPPFTAATSSPDHPGLWFFGLNRSIYGNMHIRRREAGRLAHRITGSQRA